MIPLTDLSCNKILNSQIKKGLDSVFYSRNYILGQRLAKFEKEFAKFIKVKYACGVASGTDALRLALRSLGIGAGDKVLTVSLTSPFTAIAVVEEGAIPIFCDVDEATWTIDLDDMAKKIDKKTRAIIPVHLFGNPSRMDKLLDFAKKRSLVVIEDACQAHGAKFGGKMTGSFGDAAAFSFYPTKNLGAIGDAGAVVTNNKKVAEQVKLLRHGGQTKRFWHEYRGMNSRLDEIQATVLSEKLKYLGNNNKKREKFCRQYKKLLRGLPITFQQVHEGAESANHLFVIRTPKRNSLRKYLLLRKIASDVYYPYPIHLQPAFLRFAKGRPLVVCEKLSRELLAIPLYPNLSEADQNYVARTIREFFSKNK